MIKVVKAIIWWCFDPGQPQWWARQHHSAKRSPAAAKAQVVTLQTPHFANRALDDMLSQNEGQRHV